MKRTLSLLLAVTVAAASLCSCSAVANLYAKNLTAHSWSLLHSCRDDLLRCRILESPHRKIAVVYGAAHIRFMKIHLRYLDGFTPDKKYKAEKAYSGNSSGF